jgi:Tfp pilus assembly protein PilO
MTKRFSRTRLWLWTLGAAGVLVLHLVGIVLPGQRLFTARSRELAVQRDVVEQLAGQAAFAATLEEQLHETTRAVDHWRQAAPRDPHLVDLLGKLAMLARDTGVKLVRLSPQEPTRMELIRQVPLGIELEGSFPQLMSFLGGVENLPETVWIPHVHLRPHGKTGKTVQCELLLTVFADNPEISG